jgi:hypothetical protein
MSRQIEWHTALKGPAQATNNWNLLDRVLNIAFNQVGIDKLPESLARALTTVDQIVDIINVATTKSPDGEYLNPDKQARKILDIMAEECKTDSDPGDPYASLAGVSEKLLQLRESTE